MNLLRELQEWYQSQCDEDWEHTYGISIDTLDNPGWQLQIDLTDTELENRQFVTKAYGIGDSAITSGNDWMVCKIKDRKFLGHGGPDKLDEMLSIFLKWANQNSA